MLILTDCPECLGSFTTEPVSWSRRPVTELSEVDQALWQTLGSGSQVSVGEWPDPGPAGFWSRALIVAKATSSQFDLLRELLGSGLTLPGPLACLALAGRKFHGQRGRAWAAAPGNLHLCIALQPKEVAARDGLALTMLPAVAVVAGIREASGGTLLPGIKWVNDILLEDDKIGGVLTATQSQGERLTLVVHGIGLNVAATPEVPPTPFVPSVGCLAEAGAEVALPDLFTSVLTAFGEPYLGFVRGGPAALFEAYRDDSLVIGREVCIWEDSASERVPGEPWPPPLVRGTVTGIAPDLSLSLSGVPEPVTKGRLAFAESCRGLGF
jgi:BirA family biotin operon repressor/biotin-[acetyl-CoA-carboxylase] ligase